MLKHVLAMCLLVGLVGCAGGIPEVKEPQPSQELERTMDTVRKGVELADNLTGVLCGIHNPDSAVCRTLRASLTVVRIAVAEVDRLYALYLSTGKDLAKVNAAVEAVIDALESMNRQSEHMRSVAAYAYSPGTFVGAAGGEAVEQAGPEADAPAANPYRQRADAAATR